MTLPANVIRKMYPASRSSRSCRYLQVGESERSFIRDRYLYEVAQLLHLVEHCRQIPALPVLPPGASAGVGSSSKAAIQFSAFAWIRSAGESSAAISSRGRAAAPAIRPSASPSRCVNAAALRGAAGAGSRGGNRRCQRGLCQVRRVAPLQSSRAAGPPGLGTGRQPCGFRRGPEVGATETAGRPHPR